MIYASLGNVLSLSNKKEYLIGMKTFSFGKKLKYFQGFRVLIAIKVRNLIEVKQVLSLNQAFFSTAPKKTQGRKKLKTQAKNSKIRQILV